MQHDYHIDLEDYSWVELNQWIFQTDLFDIDITNEFAIVTGESGHHIIYHSVYKDYYKEVFQYTIDARSESDLYMPNLQRIDFLAKDLELQSRDVRSSHKNIVFGITKHRFFAMEFKEVIISQSNQKPIRLECHSDSPFLVDQSPFMI